MPRGMGLNDECQRIVGGFDDLWGLVVMFVTLGLWVLVAVIYKMGSLRHKHLSLSLYILFRSSLLVLCLWLSFISLSTYCSGLVSQFPLSLYTHCSVAQHYFFIYLSCSDSRLWTWHRFVSHTLMNKVWVISESFWTRESIAIEWQTRVPRHCSSLSFSPTLV